MLLLCANLTVTGNSELSGNLDVSGSTVLYKSLNVGTMLDVSGHSTLQSTW